MFSYRSCQLVCLTFLVIVCLAELFDQSLEAQLFRRRPLRRIPAILNDGSGYRVGDALPDGPLIQGDGRFLERAQNLLNLVTSSGKELKPVAVISLASIEEFKRVFQLVAEEVRRNKGSDDDPVVLNAILAVFEKVVGKGFDTKQPIGLILQSDGVLYYPLFFTPLNLEDEMGRTFLEKYTTELPDGRSVLRKETLNWPLGSLFVKEHNGWVFIASEAQLETLPDDPTAILQGLDKDYLMAARFNLQNVPKMTTSAVLSFGEMKAVSEAQSELEKAGLRLLIRYIKSIAEQSDFMEYSLAYEEENKEYVFRQKETIKPGTERAKLHEARRNAISNFHGFYHPEGAILASHFVLFLTRHQSEQLEIIFDEILGKHLLTEEERFELRPQLAKVQRRELTKKQAETTITKSADSEGQEKAAEAKDHRDRLAELLAIETTQEQGETEQDQQASSFREASSFDSDKPEEDVPEQIPDEMPEFALSEFPEGKPDDAMQLEIILRRIGACYYWGLIGAIRNGTFDAASTISREHGMIAIYNVVEGERFGESFDAVFAEIAAKYPDLYEKLIEKDYAECRDFRLTKIKFNLSDFVRNEPWKNLIPPTLVEREKIGIVLGVRNDAVCFAIGKEDEPEEDLIVAIAAMEDNLPVNDLFFTFSAYSLGQAFAQSGDPNRFVPLKLVAANESPDANAYAYSEFTETERILTLRINALLTPSIWRFRENLRELRSHRLGY